MKNTDLIDPARVNNRAAPVASRAVAALIGCLAILPVTGGAAQAQSSTVDAPTGRVLTLTFGAGLTTSDNPDFDVNPAGSEVRTSTSLRLAYRSDTALSYLTFDADTLLLMRLSGDDKGFERPQQGIHLGYGREGGYAALKFDAGLRESRIDFLRPLSDFLDEDGEIFLPDDLDDLIGSGWRRQAYLDATLTLGRDARFGAVLGAGLSDVSYRDASNPALEDAHRRHASARLRFDLTPVTRLDLALRYGVFKDSQDRKETWSLNPGLTFDRPDGNIRAVLGVTRNEDGTRLSAEIGRAIERPWGRLDARIGAVRLANGHATMAGGLRMTYALPRAQFLIGLEREAGSGTNDTETLRTALAVDYRQSVSELSSLSVGLAYVKSDDSLTGHTTDTASLAIGYSHLLAKDWSLNLGYNFRMRDQDNTGRTTENEVSVTFSRSLVFGL